MCSKLGQYYYKKFMALSEILAVFSRLYPEEVPRDCELLQVLYKSLRYLLDGALTNLRAVFKLDHMKALMDSTKLFNTI